MGIGNVNVDDTFCALHVVTPSNVYPGSHGGSFNFGLSIQQTPNTSFSPGPHFFLQKYEAILPIEHAAAAAAAVPGPVNAIAKLTPTATSPATFALPPVAFAIPSPANLAPGNAFVGSLHILFKSFIIPSLPASI